MDSVLGRRPLAVIALAAAGLLVAGPVVAEPQGPGEKGTEFVDVVPSVNLHDGQDVFVSATGFAPNSTLAIVECTLIESGQGDCDLSTVKLGSGSDANGKLKSTPFTVHATIHVANKPGPVRCGADQCAVSVGTLDGKSGGEHCIGFGGPCQPAPPASSGPSGPSGTTSGHPSASPTNRAGGLGGSAHSNTGLVAGIIVVAILVAAGLAHLRNRPRPTAE